MVHHRGQPQETYPMKKTLISLATVVALTACGTYQVPGVGTVTLPQVDPQQVLKDGDTHELKMFKEKAKAAKDLTPPPIFKITAIAGQTMEFKGVASIEVNQQTDNAAVAALFAREKSGWEVVADYALRVGEIVVNPWVALKVGKENAITQREQIKANTAIHTSTMGTLAGIASEGINKPVFAMPLPAPTAAPAAVAEATPTVPAVTPTVAPTVPATGI